ncbi:unnamed protein product [Thelazia callipaeda]|uniref:Protein aurora borealis n=1 Tax=Thelazia callipaeda TaxID=103827 RepID=A0A0N5D696_THECL|nr:unnamed protein product [Thelazia callipaeda]
MLLIIITISVLFIYTLLLIGFFMGWCTLIPAMVHPRKEIPLCSVKSPRRNTKYGDFESTISSSVSIEHVHRIFKLPEKRERSYSECNDQPSPLSDYLHPKYSLPPLNVDIAEEQINFKQYLRTPAHLCIKKTSLSRFLSEDHSLQSKLAARPNDVIV